VSAPCCCDVCGLDYDDFKTGFTYSDIFGMLWVADDDPSRWRYKRRHTVLGLWHQIKQSMFREHVAECRREQREIDERARRERVENMQRLEVDIALLVAAAAVGAGRARVCAVPF
jgi:hypothetical protein